MRVYKTVPGNSGKKFTTKIKTMKTFMRVMLLFIALIALSLSVSYMLSGSPVEIVNSVQINKSPYEVFDYIADMRNELKWNPDVQYMEKKSAGPVEAGTVFRAKWHRSDTIDVTITQYYPPYSVGFQNGGPLEVNLLLQLFKTGDQTKLESRFTATPHGFLRAIFPIVKWQLEAQEKETMLHLKKALERKD